MIFERYCGRLQVFAVIKYTSVDIFVHNIWLRMMVPNYRVTGRGGREKFWTLVAVRFMSTVVTVIITYAHRVTKAACVVVLHDGLSLFGGGGGKVLCWELAIELRLEGVMSGNKGSWLRKSGLPRYPKGLAWVTQCELAVVPTSITKGMWDLVLQHGTTPECRRASCGITQHSQFLPGGLN